MKLRLIIIIATLDGPVYFEKVYVTCIYIYIYICFILCLYLLFLYRRMLRLALSAIFVLSLLKTIEGAAGNSLQVNRLSSSISVF